MELPHYSIVGIRPVKAVATESGGMAIFTYDWKTGEFELAMEYLEQIFFGKGEVEQVSEKAFEEYVDRLRRRSRGLE